ncbi:unnamed protein product [Lasius platythorax]|uniref:Uncharacterized protein n=1 Tax=Lasius platythorax TaxID=488582 RepID=A0AAV2NI52_9HYME
MERNLVIKYAGVAEITNFPLHTPHRTFSRGKFGLTSVSNMAGVLFEDIFNVKDIDPEGKKFDRGESRSKFMSRRIRASPRRSGTRAIFIAKMAASLASWSTLPIAPA